ncbi:hypothetical protein RHSP_31524 [Rhizobium freirei PRF 81]|uniref:Uncharacterized protein n=1 Tax=Rhizobium freirei PRF 81 TaxID=363754 RepID=N6U2H3_9HYPH|nr:hypothetical protein RHSP_31524 [Rhizobium freirei PRF 81]
MTSQHSQAPSEFFGDVVGNHREVATIFEKLAVMERIASDLTVDGRAVTPELAGHLIDRNLALDKVMKAPPIGEGQLLIASRHAKISSAKPLKSLACRT